MVFTVNLATVKFSSSKFYWQKFGLHQLGNRIHANSNIRHLQVIIASLELTAAVELVSEVIGT